MDRPLYSISFFNQRSHFLGVEPGVRRITCDKKDTLRLLLYLIGYKHFYLGTDVAKIDSKTVVVLLLFLFHRLFFPPKPILGSSSRRFDSLFEFLTCAKIRAVLQSIAKTIVFLLPIVKTSHRTIPYDHL